MYQLSRSKHALRAARMENRRPVRPEQGEVIEGLMAYLDESMPAHEPMDCEAVDQWTLNRLHAEALEMDKYMGVKEPDWMDDPWLGESMYEQDEVYFEGEDDSPNMYSHDDHWLPYAKTMDEVRDIFGGTDFIITHLFRA